MHNNRISSYKEAVDYIKADYLMYAYHGNSLIKYFIDYYKDRSVKFTFWLRLASYKRVFSLICKFMWKHYSNKFCIEISAQNNNRQGFPAPSWNGFA